MAKSREIVQCNYLMDISFLADCFKPYGAHPYNAIVKRIAPLSNGDAILLGNLANFFLDELIHAEEVPDYSETMRRFFRSSPFEVALTLDLDDPKRRKQFAEESRRQFENIKQTVLHTFANPTYSLPKEELLIEPSFVAQSMGLQGRLDAIRSNFQSFIELKSGKMEGWNERLTAAESHYMQLQLYAAMIQSIEQIEPKGYLFYSKYPQLVYEPLDNEAIDRALSLRNRIVALDVLISKSNDLEPLRQLFRSITPELLNERGLSNRFWEQYLSAPIRQFASLYRGLSEVAADYFCETYRFVVTEWYQGKSGCSEEEHIRRGRNLSKCVSLRYKVEAGEAIDGLRVTEYLNKEWARSTDSIAVIHFTTSNEDAIAQSNFRKGDLVWFYLSSESGNERLDRSITKGTIAELTTCGVWMQLQYEQRNEACFDASQVYVMEQGESEVNHNAYFHGLYYYMDANARRRALLLGDELPRSSYSAEQGEESLDDMVRIAAKVAHSQDYFLLVGPPGSGKTSLALRAIVEQECRQPNSHVLVLAFTNRAVDEVCRSLGSLHPDYPILRMGSLAACEPEYRYLHYSNQFEEITDRKGVIERLSRFRIVVSTVATFNSKIHLFRFFRYDLAVFDEASQILEPQLLSVVCAKDDEGNDLVARWVMIGDHKQLPAVVVQSDKEAAITSPLMQSLGITNFKESLFERLYRKLSSENRGACYDQIRRQGRMHPEVAEYTNVHYYGNMLRPVPLPHQEDKSLYSAFSKEGLEGLLAIHRTLFFDLATEETNPLSKQNQPEAACVAKMVETIFRLYEENGKTFDPLVSVGVIAPFRSQIALIRKELEQLSNPVFREITVDTVERYQGSQREVIIYSFCVSQPHQLNWIVSPLTMGTQTIDRKLNVVLTRAKKQYILIGNGKLLSENELFCHFIEHLQTKGCIFEARNWSPYNNT